MGTEDNNRGKEYSRQQIAIIINATMGDKPIRMIELLGCGIGAEFYLNACPNIFEMDIVEYSKKKFDNWMKNEYASFMGRIPSGKLVTCISGDIVDVFEDKKVAPYNVINLDFCTHFYENGKPTSTAYPIDSLLRNNKLEDDGLLLLTFQLTGLGANFDKRSVRDKDAIIATIGKIAEFASWSIEEVVFSYTYKSSKPTTMLNLGLRMKFNGKTIDKE